MDKKSTSIYDLHSWKIDPGPNFEKTKIQQYFFNRNLTN